MARTTRVEIPITATDKATRTIQKVRKQLMGLASAGRAAVSSMTGLGSVAGVTGLTMMARSAIDAGSAITDMATATQTGIEELQALTFAAREAGASNEQMANLLVRAQKSANDAARGLSTAKDAFAQLGINAETFIDLAPERKLEVLGQALVKADGDTRAYGAALDLLGTRNAPKLMEVLQRLGTEGFDQMAIDARNAGQIMSDEVAKSMDKTADEIGNFKTKLTNLFAEQIFIMSSELNTEIMTLQFLKLAVRFSKKMTEGVVGALKVLTAGLTGSVAVFVEGIKSGMDIGVNSFKVVTESLKIGLATIFNDFITILNTFTEAIAGLINKIPGIDVGGRQFGKIDTSQMQANLSDAMSGFSGIGFDAGQTFMDAFTESFDSSQLAPMDMFDEAIADLDFGIQTLRESLSTVGEETKKSFTESAEVVTGATEEIKGEIEELETVGSSFAMTLENGLINAAQNGKTAFGDMAQFILAELQRMIIRSLLFQSITGLGGFVGGGLGSIITAFGQNFAGGRAGGGPVKGGRSYIVGEQGPEIVTMGGNGSVTPNSALGGPTFNVDMRGASLEAVQRLERFVAAMNGTIEQRSVAAVQDRYSRAPSYMRR